MTQARKGEMNHRASREKQARIILGQAEVEIAHLFAKAAESYMEKMWGRVGPPVDMRFL